MDQMDRQRLRLGILEDSLERAVRKVAVDLVGEDAAKAQPRRAISMAAARLLTVSCGSTLTGTSPSRPNRQSREGVAGAAETTRWAARSRGCSGQPYLAK